MRPLMWAARMAIASHLALNRGRPDGVLRRIDLNLTWTGNQLVDTLLSETPVRNSAILTLKPSNHQLLGMAVEIPSAELPPPWLPPLLPAPGELPAWLPPPLPAPLELPRLFPAPPELPAWPLPQSWAGFT